MNIADLLVKMFLGGNAGGGMASPVEISKQILTQLKNVLKSLIILFICSVTFCILMGYLVDRTLTQMDSGPFELTNSIVFLLVLIAVNLVIIAWSLKKASAKDETPAREKISELRSPDSPLETAIAALIFNYIKEREAAKEKSEVVKQVSPETQPPL